MRAVQSVMWHRGRTRTWIRSYRRVGAERSMLGCESCDFCAVDDAWTGPPPFQLIARTTSAPTRAGAGVTGGRPEQEACGRSIARRQPDAHRAEQSVESRTVGRGGGRAVMGRETRRARLDDYRRSCRSHLHAVARHGSVLNGQGRESAARRTDVARSRTALPQRSSTPTARVATLVRRIVAHRGIVAQVGRVNTGTRLPPRAAGLELDSMPG